MKESQLRQLIREEISKVMNKEENLGEIYNDPAVLDLLTVGKILGSMGLTILGVNLAKNKLQAKAAEGDQTSQAILDFFKGFASGGGSGK
jgi:hypothetical protein